MATKAEIIASLRRYDTEEKGWSRRNFRGDNLQIAYLKAILALPHIAELSDDASISARSLIGELIRLDINYRAIYTPGFLMGTHASSRLFQHLFPDVLTDITTPTALDALTAITPKAAPPYDTSDITKVVITMRDKLFVYQALIRNQSPIVSFFSGLLEGSGAAGVERAAGYLRIVDNSLRNYDLIGTINPVLNMAADSAGFGKHTKDIVVPSLNKRMEIIVDLLKFTSATFETTWGSADEFPARTKCKVGFSSTKIEGEFDCNCSREKFNIFLEDYLCKNNISLTRRELKTTFSPTDFLNKFSEYLNSLIKAELSARSERAARAAKDREDSITAGCGM